MFPASPLASTFDLGSEMFGGHLPQADFLKRQQFNCTVKMQCLQIKGLGEELLLTRHVATATTRRYSFPLYLPGQACKYCDLSPALAGKSPLPKAVHIFLQTELVFCACTDPALQRPQRPQGSRAALAPGTISITWELDQAQQRRGAGLGRSSWLGATPPTSISHRHQC